jgi:Peptidase family M1 domain
VTKVIRIIPSNALTMFSLALALFTAPSSNAQATAVTAAPPFAVTAATQPDHSAEALYLQLQSVGLDKSRVYNIREVTLERAAFHITFDDGTIAFTEDVAGHVTGAFFEGEGEVLLIPNSQAERASMMLFTGAAILEEKFVTAYFRFNDDTFAELQPWLRAADNAPEFVSQWDSTARNLAQLDALRLLLSFSNSLPTSGQEETVSPASKGRADDDRMLHARLQGRSLGTFDLYFDSLAAEQIWAGQQKTVEGELYYDVWSAFSLGQPHGRSGDAAGVMGEEAKPEAFSVSHYKIRAKVAPPTRLDADASLQLEVRQAGQRAVLFELSRFLQVSRVEADGRPLEFIQNQALEGTQLARRGNDLVAVIFPQPLRAGQQINLHFAYGGDVLSEAGAGLLYVGARGTWYPNRGLEMARFDLQFRYPQDWTLLATGKRMEGAPSDLPPGEQFSHWVSDRPMPVAGFNLGKYSRVVARAGDVSVEAYASSGVERSFPQGSSQALVPQPTAPFPQRSRPEQITVLAASPSPAHNAQAVANLSARAVEFFAHRFGPYPYTSLALTQMPGELSQGWPSLVFLSSFSFLTPEEKSELHMSSAAKILSENVIAHETAHQWWGDLLSWKSYRDQWLFEALANYSALLLLESESPAQFHMIMERYRQDLLAKNKEGSPLAEVGPVTFGTRLNCSHFPAGYDAISYGRGTWLFHMLRTMLRDAERTSSGHASNLSDTQADMLFLRALSKARERFQERAINTREFLQVFEEELPPSLRYEGRKSLDWFYEGWVNGTALPHLELQSVKYTQKPGGSVVTGTIVQKDAPQELVTVVPVYAVLVGKNVLLGQVFADGPETNFHLSAPPGTRRIVLDPYQTLLTRP